MDREAVLRYLSETSVAKILQICKNILRSIQLLIFVTPYSLLATNCHVTSSMHVMLMCLVLIKKKSEKSKPEKFKCCEKGSFSSQKVLVGITLNVE